VKKFVLFMILLAIPVIAAEDFKPLPQDAQLKLLKGQREMQQLQIQIGSLQSQMEGDCAAAAKESNVDLSKFTCDLDKLSFVPRAEKKEAAAAQPKKETAPAQSKKETTPAQPKQ
jgi:hypothetical protein